MTHSSRTADSELRALLIAVGLSLGVSISLGMARFSFALLLPPMRDDLGWSYALSGGLNTANALGYLVGALLTPALLRRSDAKFTLIGGAVLTSVFMAACAGFTDAQALLILRLLSGVGSALVFVAGGLLTARLGARYPSRSGLILGIYYSGAGLGIVLSSFTVPWVLDQSAQHALVHGWQPAWMWLGLLCGIATVPMAWAARHVDGIPAVAGSGAPVQIRRLRLALAAYFMFGVGYIGYMTFIIALLRQQQFGSTGITAFYVLLGMACMASSRLWAPLLDRFRGGESLSLLSALLGSATLMAALSESTPVLYASGLIFGGVFLSTVASTTALVKHNLPPEQWASGISAFTVIFAIGQVIGPTLTGQISDGGVGLRGGLVFSGLALLLGSALSSRQRSLAAVA